MVTGPLTPSGVSGVVPEVVAEPPPPPPQAASARRAADAAKPAATWIDALISVCMGRSIPNGCVRPGWCRAVAITHKLCGDPTYSPSTRYPPMPVIGLFYSAGDPT